MFPRKIITSTGFYRYWAPDASAPVVVINESPSWLPNDGKGWGVCLRSLYLDGGLCVPP